MACFERERVKERDVREVVRTDEDERKGESEKKKKKKRKKERERNNMISL